MPVRWDGEPVRACGQVLRLSWFPEKQIVMESFEVQFHLTSFVAVLTLAVTPFASHAGLYKCVDAAGKVSFQERACPHTSASSEITVKGAQPVPSAKDKAGMGDLSMEAGSVRTGKVHSGASLVEINSASQADLQGVVGDKVAAQILAERNNGRFRDWADVVRRVVALSAAQTAVVASVSGLTVNGKSLNGAPPNPEMAALMKGRRR